MTAALRIGPKAWPMVPLAKLALETQYGTAQKANEDGRGLPILRMNNLTSDGQLDLCDLKHVELPAEDIEAYTTRPGDLLFNRTNSPELVGKMVVWDRPEMFAIAGYLVRVRVDPHRMNPKFVAYWFNTPEMKAQLRARAKPSINMANLSASELLKFSVPVPSLSEQARVVAVLDQAQALRSLRRSALGTCGELVEALFYDRFGDLAVNAKQWPRVPLRDLCSSDDDIKCGPFGTQLGKDEYTSEGVPLWGIKHVNARFELATHEFLDAMTAQRLAQYSIVPGDLVMTRKGTVGNCAMYPSGYPVGIMHSDLLRLRVDSSRCVPDFLLHQLRLSQDVVRQLARISGGAIMPGINVTKLKSLKVVVPPAQLQREFVRRQSIVENLRTSHCASMAALNSLYSSLQHRAFRGEL